MAKPIDPIPELKGRDAERFIKAMNNPKKITKKEKKLFRELMKFEIKISKKADVC